MPVAAVRLNGGMGAIIFSIAIAAPFRAPSAVSTCAKKIELPSFLEARKTYSFEEKLKRMVLRTKLKVSLGAPQRWCLVHSRPFWGFGFVFFFLGCALLFKVWRVLICCLLT